jgi:hypothetical protein
MLKHTKKQKGQGMVEYIVIVALIGLSAILVFSYFGQTVRDQAAQMSSQVAGNVGATGQNDASTTAGKAVTAAKTASGLDKYYDANHSAQ